MKPILSICMMVKDEEANLASCLQSLQPLREKVSSELIIVDTGSTDQTIAIAKQYTDKVYYHLWDNNFSQMRNITIGYATGKWILIIDADEQLEKCDGIIKLLTSIIDKQIGYIALMVKNITDLKRGLYAGTLSPRIFRNSNDFCYQGSVHNEPVFKGRGVDSGDSLLHYGYLLSDKKLMEKKFQRTSLLLKKELEKNPKNIYYRYQLGITYSMHGDRELALREFESLYMEYKQDDTILKTNVYLFGGLLQSYVAMRHDRDEVITIALHGLRLEPEYVDLYSYLAHIYIFRGDYENAYSYFAQHVDLIKRFADLKIRDNLSINHYSLNDLASDYYHLALMAYKNKRYDKVRGHIEAALSEVGGDAALAALIDNVLLEFEFNEKNYDNCKVIYEKLVANNQEDEMKKFREYGEAHWQQLSSEERLKYCECFQCLSGLYGLLNRIRFNAEEVDRDEWLTTLKNMDNQEVNELPVCYAPLFVYLMKSYPQDIWRYSACFSEQTLVEYMKYMDEVDKLLFVEICRNFITVTPENESNEYQIIRIQKMMAKYLLFSGVLATEEYKNVFGIYIEKGKYYLETLYNEIVFAQELVYDVKNKEEMFLLYMILSQRFAKSGSKAVNYLKKALAVYPEMSKGVGMALQSLADNERNNELEELIEKLLVIVEEHIADGQFALALKTLLECEAVIGPNLKLLSKKAEIYQKQAEITIGK